MIFLQERNDQNEEQNGYNCLTILNIIQIRFFLNLKLQCSQKMVVCH